MKKPIKRLLKPTLASALALAIILALSGCDIIGDLLGTSQQGSRPPTDENGANILGNSMENLQSGGFVTQQGDDIFFANFDDGGKLYCLDRNGYLTRLTDFAVANLNIRGDALIFTDLETCSYTDTGGRTQYVNARVHEDIWAAAGSTQNIRYGGNFYALHGVQSFCEGKIGIGEMTLYHGEGDGSTYYQQPVFTQEGVVMGVVTRNSPLVKKSIVYINGDGEEIEITVAQGDDETVESFILLGDDLLVQIQDEASGKRHIVRCGLPGGEIVDTANGHSLMAWLDCPIFISGEDGLVYLWDLEDDEFIRLSSITPLSKLMSGGHFREMDGLRQGPVFFGRLGDGSVRPVYLVAVPDGNAKDWEPGGNFLLAEDEGTPLTKLELTVFSVTVERLEYVWYYDENRADDSRSDGEGCGCFDECACIDRCDCGDDCGCVHCTIVQEVDGESKKVGSVWGVPQGGDSSSPTTAEQIRQDPKPTVTPTPSPDPGDGSTGDGDEEKPEDRMGPVTSIVEGIFDGSILDRFPTPYPSPSPGTGDSTGDDGTEEDTGTVDYDVPISDEFEVVGEPANLGPDDTSKLPFDLIPPTYQDYLNFSRANGSPAPSMDKTDIDMDLYIGLLAMRGDSFVFNDYILDEGTWLAVVGDSYEPHIANAWLAFASGGGFRGDVQTTRLFLYFEKDLYGDGSVDLLRMDTTPPLILFSMDDCTKKHLLGVDDNEVYSTEFKSSLGPPLREPSAVWDRENAYLTVGLIGSADGGKTLGLCLSFGRTADGEVIAHGWAIGGDPRSTRKLWEVNLKAFNWE